LEVYYETGETITAHNLKTQQIPPKYNAFWFALEDENRQDLYNRIDSRVEKMLDAGLIDEIKTLLAAGIPEKCTAMQAIGYKEFVTYLNGGCTLEDAATLVQQASRHYAKRQLTWFRRNGQIHWLRRKSGENTEQILQTALQLLTNSDK
jgi:tRNA dimethylallyltransferase